jgi:hypothetical protein
MAKTKTTGLAAFTNHRSVPAAPDEAPAAAAVGSAQAPARAPAVPGRARGQGTPAGRKRGQGATVALSVRLARADWERLHQLAVAEGVSLQEIMVRGLSQVFTSKGLPGIGA